MMAEGLTTDEPGCMFSIALLITLRDEGMMQRQAILTPRGKKWGVPPIIKCPQAAAGAPRGGWSSCKSGKAIPVAVMICMDRCSLRSSGVSLLPFPHSVERSRGFSPPSLAVHWGFTPRTAANPWASATVSLTAAAGRLRPLSGINGRSCCRHAHAHSKGGHHGK